MGVSGISKDSDDDYAGVLKRNLLGKRLFFSYPAQESINVSWGHIVLPGNLFDGHIGTGRHIIIAEAF